MDSQKENKENRAEETSEEIILENSPKSVIYTKRGFIMFRKYQTEKNTKQTNEPTKPPTSSQVIFKLNENNNKETVLKAATVIGEGGDYRQRNKDKNYTNNLARNCATKTMDDIFKALEKKKKQQLSSHNSISTENILQR